MSCYIMLCHVMLCYILLFGHILFFYMAAIACQLHLVFLNPAPRKPDPMVGWHCVLLLGIRPKHEFPSYRRTYPEPDWRAYWDRTAQLCHPRNNRCRTGWTRKHCRNACTPKSCQTTFTSKSCFYQENMQITTHFDFNEVCRTGCDD